MAPRQSGAVASDTESRVNPIRRDPPPFRRLTIRGIEDLTPHMRRFVVGGDELDGLEIPDPAMSVRLLIPEDDGSLVMPEWTGNQFERPDGSRAPIRTLTPRFLDAEAGELTLDVVLHDAGAASDWARRARVGEPVAISGPARGHEVEPDVPGYLLAGDETAIPAISQLLEAMPASTEVDVHVEVRGPDARLDLPEHPKATVHWHETPDGAEPGDALVHAVTALDELPPRVWAAGEAAAVQKLRKHLFDVRGMARSDATVRGYWKHGRSAT